jgi:hypothetical protein
VFERIKNFIASRSVNRANRRAVKSEVRDFRRVMNAFPGKYGPEKIMMVTDMRFCDSMAMEARLVASDLYLSGKCTVLEAFDEAEIQFVKSIKQVADDKVAKMFRHLWKTMTVSDKLTDAARNKLSNDSAAILKDWNEGAFARKQKSNEKR